MNVGIARERCVMNDDIASGVNDEFRSSERQSHRSNRYGPRESPGWTLHAQLLSHPGDERIAARPARVLVAVEFDQTAWPSSYLPQRANRVIVRGDRPAEEW